MDEIFDRLKSRIRKIKFNRKSLIFTLILVELLGILVLAGYLRKPLTQKFLTAAPKAYSILVMNNKSRYVVHHGDYLTGKTIPETKVVTLITPDKIKQRIISDKEGNWSYQIPSDLKESRHQFSVGYFDTSNKLVFFKTYKIRVASNNKFKLWLNSLAQILPIKKAQAQFSEVESGAQGSSIQSISDTLTIPQINVPTNSDSALSNYNIVIFDLGKNSVGLNPGSTISPIVGVFDQSKVSITQDDNMTLNFTIRNAEGEGFDLIPLEECSGIKPCIRQIPPGLPPGDYILRAELIVRSQSGDEVATSEEPLTIGQTSSLVADGSVGVSTELSYANGPCYGNICPEQIGAKVIPLESIYTSNPQIDPIDASPMNLIADCSDNCLIPQTFIRSRYSQKTVDIISDFFESDKQELVNCLQNSSSHPSNSTSLAASLAILSESFGKVDPLGLQSSYILFQLVNTSSVACFVGHENEQNLSNYARSDLNFADISLRNDASFEDLAGYFNETTKPIVVGINYNQTDPHYAVLIGITDNYVWIIDPSDPQEGNFALRFDKQTFTNNYFNGNYWAISSNSP